MLLNIILLIISIIVSFTSYYDVVLKVIIEYNLFCLLFVLGVASIIKKINFRKNTKFEVIISLIFLMIFAIVCNTNMQISRIEGFLLIILYILFILYYFKKNAKNNKNKKKSSITIENILNSNIFNILFIVGLLALIKPIKYSVSYNLDMIILIWGTLILLVFPKISSKKEIMSKYNGLVYLSLYIIYICLSIFVF